MDVVLFDDWLSIGEKHGHDVEIPRILANVLYNGT